MVSGKSGPKQVGRAGQHDRSSRSSSRVSSSARATARTMSWSAGSAVRERDSRADRLEERPRGDLGVELRAQAGHERLAALAGQVAVRADDPLLDPAGVDDDDDHHPVRPGAEPARYGARWTG